MAVPLVRHPRDDRSPGRRGSIGLIQGEELPPDACTMLKRSRAPWPVTARLQFAAVHGAALEFNFLELVPTSTKVPCGAYFKALGRIAANCPNTANSPFVMMGSGVRSHLSGTNLARGIEDFYVRIERHFHAIQECPRPPARLLAGYTQNGASRCNGVSHPLASTSANPALQRRWDFVAQGRTLTETLHHI